MISGNLYNNKYCCYCDDLDILKNTIELKIKSCPQYYDLIWRDELVPFKFADRLQYIDNLDSQFQGFKYLYELKLYFTGDIELSEYSSETLSLIAQQNPIKFVEVLNSKSDYREREKIYSILWFGSDKLNQKFLSAVEGSGYYSEIIKSSQ